MKYLFFNIGGIHPGCSVHIRWACLIDEDVRQHHGAELQPVIEDAFVAQKLRNVASKATDGATSR